MQASGSNGYTQRSFFQGLGSKQLTLAEAWVGAAAKFGRQDHESGRSVEGERETGPREEERRDPTGNDGAECIG
jgi:hypothetical protein